MRGFLPLSVTGNGRLADGSGLRSRGNYRAGSVSGCGTPKPAQLHFRAPACRQLSLLLLLLAIHFRKITLRHFHEHIEDVSAAVSRSEARTVLGIFFGMGKRI